MEVIAPNAEGGCVGICIPVCFIMCLPDWSFVSDIIAWETVLYIPPQ